MSDIDRLMRDFNRYTGDGLPGEPAGAPLPIGDPTSGAFTPKKKDLRDWGAAIEAAAAGYVSAAAASAQSAAESAAISDRLDRQLDHFIARMHRGDTVSIAAYGDSTTDGANTTSYVANPVTGTTPDGDTDHNVVGAPNAYPAQLQALLRLMYDNGNINVWNAGYTGRKLSDGWAFANYDAAVTDNPHYGVPDITLIAFGANDVKDAGSQIDDTIAQTALLIVKLLMAGTLPILLTGDWGVGASDRSAAEWSREVDRVKREIAARYDIPIIDIYGAETEWTSVRYDGGSATRQFSVVDDLHPNDTGHKIKAAILARAFYPDVIPLNNKLPHRVSWTDRRVLSNVALINNRSPNNAFGNNARNVPNGEDAMRFWLWVDQPAVDLIYQGIKGEGNAVNADPADYPSIDLVEYATGTTASVFPSNTGLQTYSSGTYASSEIPQFVARLDYGLHQITVTGWQDAEAFDQRYMGFFELVEAKPDGQFDALAGLGPVVHKFTSGSDQIKVLPRVPSHVIGLAGDGICTLYVDVTLPVGVGLLVTQLLSDLGLVNDPGDIVGTAWVRYNTTNWLLMRPRENDNAPVYITGQLGSAVTGLTSADRKQWRIEIERDSGADISGWKIFEGWDSTVDVLGGAGRVSAANYGVHLHGYVGGFVYDDSQAGGDATAILHSFHVVRS